MSKLTQGLWLRSPTGFLKVSVKLFSDLGFYCRD